MVEHMECPRAVLGKLVPEFFFFPVKDRPAPNAQDQNPPPTQHTKRLGTVLRRLYTARIDRCFAWVHFLQQGVAALRADLIIPYLPAPVIKVPDLTGEQQGAINTIVSAMVKTVQAPRWQRQAIRAATRVVLMVPPVAGFFVRCLVGRTYQIWRTTLFC